jgi:lipopolysaccharide transport system ATP-binding protein
MPQPIIQIEDIGKAYRLGEADIRHATFRDAVVDMVQAPFRRLKELGQAPKDKEPFWALRNITFDVHPGEVVGIIGRNGAGKSTLLKILSRITEPTEGQVTLRGRVASLLEVGTGFHPDLTGRENVYLNGAILGMSKAEIDRKFDEIVAFAEVESFLDTPVKHYSSGMYVRLAFAVAAHLEPEILIIDEVLAVGDTEFQKKCLGKMHDVAVGGRTVLFVSHNMNAVERLCSRALVLKKGNLAYAGDVRGAMYNYGISSRVSSRMDFAAETGGSILRSMCIRQNNELTDGLLEPLAEVTFDFAIAAPRLLKSPRLSVAFANAKGDRVFTVASWLGPGSLPSVQGNRSIRIAFEMPPVIPGRYTVDVAFHDSDASVSEEYLYAGVIEVAETNYLQTLEPNAAGIGQIQVRSRVSLLPGAAPDA